MILAFAMELLIVRNIQLTHELCTEQHCNLASVENFTDSPIIQASFFLVHSDWLTKNDCSTSSV